MTPPMTPQDLAKRLKAHGLDIGKAGVADIESGVRPVQHFELVVLAGILNTTVYGLIGGE